MLFNGTNCLFVTNRCTQKNRFFIKYKHSAIKVKKMRVIQFDRYHFSLELLHHPLMRLFGASQAIPAKIHVAGQVFKIRLAFKKGIRYMNVVSKFIEKIPANGRFSLSSFCPEIGNNRYRNFKMVENHPNV